MELSQEMEKLCRQAFVDFPIENATVVHRIGTVPVGESSIAVAVSSPHRQAAFEAAQWLIDTLKRNVPIWKQENWADGSTEWIHPEGAVRAQEEPKQ